MTERLERIPDSNVTKRELQFVEDEIHSSSGTLKNAGSNAAFLSDTDTVYLDINTDVTLGDVFPVLPTPERPTTPGNWWPHGQYCRSRWRSSGPGAGKGHASEPFSSLSSLFVVTG